MSNFMEGESMHQAPCSTRVHRSSTNEKSETGISLQVVTVVVINLTVA